MLGVFVPDRDVVFEEREGHIVLRTAIAPDEDFRYYFGFAWDAPTHKRHDRMGQLPEVFSNTRQLIVAY